MACHLWQEWRLVSYQMVSRVVLGANWPSVALMKSFAIVRYTASVEKNWGIPCNSMYSRISSMILTLVYHISTVDCQRSCQYGSLDNSIPAFLEGYLDSGPASARITIICSVEVGRVGMWLSSLKNEINTVDPFTSSRQVILTSYMPTNNRRI